MLHVCSLSGPWTQIPQLCDIGHDKLTHTPTALSHGWWNGAGGRSAYLKTRGVSHGDIQMKRNLVILAVAASLAGMVATDALAAGHGFGGGHVGGRFGAPLVGSAPMTSPIYNPSTPYTVTQSPEVPVSPASPGSLFH